MTITAEQLRVGLGLTRAEWRELQHAAIDREMSTRELAALSIRTALMLFSICSEPASIQQSQSTRSPEQGSSDGTTSNCSKARCST